MAKIIIIRSSGDGKRMKMVSGADGDGDQRRETFARENI